MYVYIPPADPNTTTNRLRPQLSNIISRTAANRPASLYVEGHLYGAVELNYSTCSTGVYLQYFKTLPFCDEPGNFFGGRRELNNVPGTENPTYYFGK